MVSVKRYINDKQYFCVTRQSLKLRLILAKGFFRGKGEFLGAADGVMVHCGLQRGTSNVPLSLPFLLFPPRVKWYNALKSTSSLRRRTKYS